jgi:hypothetical protein
MTDPTQAHGQEQAPWRLVLEEGEQLEVRTADSIPTSQASRSAVVLSMPAWRAADLARVMDAYSRISAIFAETSEVSGTESSLARALSDAAAAATGADDPPTAEPARVGHRGRLKAMAMLQKARPELSHGKLIAIVDAAARWLDDDMDHMAMDLLNTIDDDQGMALYFTLLGRSSTGEPLPASTE